jgi:transcriptional regulator with XRE-family HTH domain
VSHAKVLKEARNRKGLKQDEVAAAAGIPRTQYVGMEGGLIPSPARWRAVLGVLGVEEESYLAAMTPDDRERALNEKRRGRRNPERAGELGPVGFMRDPGKGANKRKRLLDMPDDSMAPAFMKGDAVWVDTLEPARAGEIVAMRAGGNWLVRRLVRVDDSRGEVVLEALNGGPLERVPAGEVIYRVV